MSDVRNDFNQQIIDEFRANGGKVGGSFEGADMLLLHHIGAKSGTERVTPLVYRRDGDDRVIFASKAGALTHPDWYHNLVANPEVTIEVGEETGVPVSAVVLHGEARARIWDAQTTEAPQFAEYARQAGSRIIPVVVLEPR
jgi:deazaflavin-dependent oxidoreductase (nitroreductase family)